VRILCDQAYKSHVLVCEEQRNSEGNIATEIIAQRGRVRSIEQVGQGIKRAGTFLTRRIASQSAALVSSATYHEMWSRNESHCARHVVLCCVVLCDFAQCSSYQCFEGCVSLTRYLTCDGGVSDCFLNQKRAVHLLANLRDDAWIRLINKETIVL
jgi:hypothetical protein